MLLFLFSINIDFVYDFVYKFQNKLARMSTGSEANLAEMYNAPKFDTQIHIQKVDAFFIPTKELEIPNFDYRIITKIHGT